MSALVDCAFQLDAVEQGDAVGDRDEFEIAAAFGLESLLDLRARTPFGGEALIGVDGERSPARVGGQGSGRKGARIRDRKSRAHRRLLHCVLKGN